MQQVVSEFAGRCRGALLGTAFGDALGLPVEGMSAAGILRQFGTIRTYLPMAEGAGRTSDDTQLTLATAISLVRRQGVDSEDCARSCAELFDPKRGYGRSAQQVLSALKRGHDYRQTGTLLFPEGSFGNGAAMRIAPVGLLCGHLPALKLRRQVFAAVRSTHVHDEAIDAALLMALLVGRFSRMKSSVAIDVRLLLDELGAYCVDPRMRRQLALAAELLAAEVDDRSAAEQLGCGVRSAESVVLALLLACRYLDDAETAVIQAVSCGGDTDTIAALVGARHGDQIFPERWHAGLERGACGYETLTRVAGNLAATAVRNGFFVDFSE